VAGVILLVAGGSLGVGVVIVRKRINRPNTASSERPTVALSTIVRPPADRQPTKPGDPRKIGNFKVRGLLGKGGMGAVWLCTRNGKLIAVKTLLPHNNADMWQELVSRFRREASVHIQLPHSDFLVPLVDLELNGDTPWLAIEFVDALPLNKLVVAHYPSGLPRQELLALFLGMAHALNQLHDVGIVHRDLKPSNILMATSGPKLIDFGIARPIGGTRVTSTGVFVGTPDFTAPEYVEKPQVLSAPGDIFSLASVMVFAATGATAFKGGSDAQILLAIANNEPDLSQVPDYIRDVIQRCFNKNPADRPTARELREIIARIAHA